MTQDTDMNEEEQGGFKRETMWMMIQRPVRLYGETGRELWTLKRDTRDGGEFMMEVQVKKSEGSGIIIPSREIAFEEVPGEVIEEFFDRLVAINVDFDEIREELDA